MKNVDADLEDDLRPEYDFRALRVRRLGAGRKSFGDVIRLEPDVADAFQMRKQSIRLFGF